MSRITSWGARIALVAFAAAPSACASATAEPRVLDADYETLWTRPTPQPLNGECSARHDQLYATRIGLNRDSLAVDLRLEEGAPGELEARWRGGSTTPAVQLLVDGCPVPAPQVQGRMLYGGPDARVVLPRRALPRGDLTLIFEAFDQRHTLLLVNGERGLDTATSEEHARWVERPGDPATGEEPTLVYQDPECDLVAQRSAP